MDHHRIACVARIGQPAGLAQVPQIPDPQQQRVLKGATQQAVGKQAARSRIEEQRLFLAADQIR
jgi:hypothetical protein